MAESATREAVTKSTARYSVAESDAQDNVLTFYRMSHMEAIIEATGAGCQRGERKQSCER
jgi:hypothetical protein